MLQLTKRTEYGLIALTHLAQREGEVTSVRALCEQYPLPKRLVAEVLKDLSRADLVESHRGASGGYTLARPAAEVSVADVVRVLEGGPALAACSSPESAGLGHCDMEPVCPIRSPIQTLRQGIWSLLAKTSLADLAGSSLPAAQAVLPPS